MPQTRQERSECYAAIEQVLEKRGLDYEIHGLPGAEDIVSYEEYWLTNQPGAAMLFPAIVDATPETEALLPGMIARAVEAHSGAERPVSYYVVLCGDGWTADRIQALRDAVSTLIVGGPPLTIETLEDFQRTGV